MGRKRKYGRGVHGVLVLNKPADFTSNVALQRAKRLFYANKAGHTGSLDPLATGVLPICFGEATKFSQYLLDADKAYLSTFRLGVATSTADCEGEITSSIDASEVEGSDVEAALEQFRGDILQVPPMVSALKYQGQPLYKLARQGIEVERPPRPVCIYSLEMVDFRPGVVAEVDVAVTCSKGTYIRSIAHDLGQSLGVGGHVARLHRTQAAGFNESQAISLEDLELERGDLTAEVLDHHLLPVDSALRDMPIIDLDSTSAHYFRQGQAIMDLRVYRLGEQGDTVRVCQTEGQFLGLGEITDDGCVAPRRVMVFD